MNIEDETLLITFKYEGTVLLKQKIPSFWKSTFHCKLLKSRYFYIMQRYCFNHVKEFLPHPTQTFLTLPNNEK
jgi:hypothetical protein